MIKIICDKCGAEIKNDDSMRRLSISTNKNLVLKGTDKNGYSTYADDTIDNIQLCQKCASEIIASLAPEIQARIYKPEVPDG